MTWGDPRLSEEEWGVVRSALLAASANAEEMLGRDLPAMIRTSYHRDLAEYNALYDKLADL